MQIIISDSSCLIDLRKAELLKAFLLLPYEIVIPNTLFEEELLRFSEQEKKSLLEDGLKVLDLPGTGVRRAIKLEADFVTSLVVADVYGMAHHNVLRNIDNICKQLIDLKSEIKIDFSEYKDGTGKSNRMAILTEEQFLVAMPYIGGQKSLKGQILLVQEFKRLREAEANKNRHIDAIRSLLLLDAPATWEKLYPDSFFIALMNLHGHEFNGNRSTPSYCSAIIRRWIYEIVLPVELLHETNSFNII